MENIIVKSSGKLYWKGREYKVAIGKNGVTKVGEEGDNATPLGCFPLRKIYYRSDKIDKPISKLEVIELEKDDGWSDDIGKLDYNTHVKLPYDGSHEELWRDDHLYDIIVILGYNDEPAIAGRGSAIFMHIARESYSPTAGCVALSQTDLMKILESIEIETKICIED